MCCFSFVSGWGAFDEREKWPEGPEPRAIKGTEIPVYEWTGYLNRPLLLLSVPCPFKSLVPSNSISSVLIVIILKFLGHGTLSSSYGAEGSKPPPGPKMPDGTRGFTMGRGRPPVSSPN